MSHENQIIYCSIQTYLAEDICHKYQNSKIFQNEIFLAWNIRELHSLTWLGATEATSKGGENEEAA